MRVLSNLLAVIAFVGSAPVSFAADVTFRVAVLPTANYLTILRSSGLLDGPLAAVGARAQFLGPLDPINAYDAVAAGNADATSTGTGYFVHFSAQKGSWVAFALEKYSGDSQGIVAAPGSGVESLKDLYGKKVAIGARGATGDYLLDLAFKEAGLDVSKVEKVSLDTSSAAVAFSSGQVAALSSYDQNLAYALATPGAKVLVRGNQLHSYNWSIHIASREFAEKHPDVLKAVYAGLVAQSERAHKNPSIIAKAYKDFGADDDLVNQVKTFDTPTIRPLDAKAVADLNALGAQYVEFGFIKSTPDIANYVVDLSK